MQRSLRNIKRRNTKAKKAEQTVLLFPSRGIRHQWTVPNCRHMGTVPNCRDYYLSLSPMSAITHLSLSPMNVCCFRCKTAPIDWSFKNVPNDYSFNSVPNEWG